MSFTALSVRRSSSPSLEKSSPSDSRASPTSRMLRVLALGALLFCAWIASGAAPDEVQARWSLQEGDLAVWKISPIPVEKNEKIPALIRGRFAGIFGYQIDDEVGARFPVQSVLDIPLDLALKVPLGRVKKGRVLDLDLRYDDKEDIPCKAELRGKVVKVQDGKFRFRGAFSVDPVKDFGRSGVIAPESFQGTFDTLFDGERGVVETSTVRILPQKGKKRRRNPGKRISRLRDEVHGVRLELKEIRRREPHLAWRKETDESIRKGVVWLKKKYEDAKGRGQPKKRPKGRGQRAMVYFCGWDCLAALTLLASEVPRDDPVVESLIEGICGYDLRQTYDISLGLMALEAYLREEPDGQRTRARRSGKKDLKWMEEMTRRLLKNANRRTDGWDWGYGDGRGSADLSNTQYAALGLFAAWRAGVKISPEVWPNLALGVLRYQSDGEPVPLHIVREGEEEPVTATEGQKGKGQKTQERKRLPGERTRERKRRPGESSQERKRVPASGFGYHASSAASYGSMTVAGIATLQIVLEVLNKEEGPKLAPKLAGQVREAINEGWAWMADNWLIQGNPRGPGLWPLYYLYGLERAGVLCGVHSVNGREWYAEGASWLVSTQEEDGSWTGGGHVVDTCFALLFLKQSTRLEPLEPLEPVDPKKTREGPRRKTPERKRRSGER